MGLIVGIVLARLLVPLLIPRFELVIIVALVLDAIDNSLLAAFTDVDLGPDGPYQSVDKALDIYYLAIAYAAMLRNWTSHAAFRIGQFLFYYRLVGVLAFELLDDRAMLLVFPNTFEYFFIVYALIALRWEPSQLARPGSGCWTAAALWVCVKLPQEYWIHIAQRDFTGTRRRPPVVRRGLALGLVVARRALPLRRPATHARAGPPAPARRRPDPGRPSSRTAWDWTDFVEKTVLLSLLSMIFAHILPDVDTSAPDIAVGVGVIVAANTAMSLRWSYMEFGALLLTNLGLIFVLSRFFSDAENFPSAPPCSSRS